jgi:hypothetical protein
MWPKRRMRVLRRRVWSAWHPGAARSGHGCHEPRTGRAGRDGSQRERGLDHQAAHRAGWTAGRFSRNRSFLQGAAFTGYRHIPGRARAKADERHKCLSGEMPAGPAPRSPCALALIRANCPAKRGDQGTVTGVNAGASGMYAKITAGQSGFLPRAFRARCKVVFVALRCGADRTSPRICKATRQTRRPPRLRADCGIRLHGAGKRTSLSTSRKEARYARHYCLA